MELKALENIKRGALLSITGDVNNPSVYAAPTAHVQAPIGVAARDIAAGEIIKFRVDGNTDDIITEMASAYTLLNNPQPTPDYVDITAGRHKGNKQSQNANKRAAPGKASWSGRILELMFAYDKNGCGLTMIETARYFKKERNTIAPRFSDLSLRFGLIEPTGFEREGAMVYRLKGSPRVPLKSVAQGDAG